MKPQYFILALITVTIFFLGKLFDPFLKPLFVAFLLFVATNSMYQFLYSKNHNAFTTSVTMSILLTVIFFAPLIYFIGTFATYLNSINQKEIIAIFDITKVWISNIPDDYDFIKEQLISVMEKIDIGTSFQKLISFGAYLGKNSARFMIDMVMILVFYFFYSYYSKSLSQYFKEVLPIHKEDSNLLFQESSNVMSIVLYSVFVTAVFEGILFGVFISLFGYDGILFGILYGFASLIPVIGGAIMWLPLSLYEFVQGDIQGAIIIALYTIIVISLIADTFIKPIIIKYINQKIVKTPTKINEMLIFFAIVAGLSTFGFWGIIIGPAMVTFLISLIQLLKKYSSEK